MTLQDLEDNQEVEIEIIWGDKSFSIPSKVKGKSSAGVLLLPYVTNGNEITINDNMTKTFTFNLYAIESDTKKRVGWKSVDLQSVPYDGEHYYACKVRSFSRDSRESDRRSEERIPIGVSGNATDLASKTRENITIKDISEKGIGFIAEKSIDFKRMQQKITFSDSVSDEDFEFAFNAKIVRIVSEGDKKLYGCKIVDMPKDISLYIFLKKMSDREFNY
ncbi:MAG: PilZ domain-containing protein [Lachnospiraceae bacterium]|nr:PilZ domain-containing protein [Lachnospiraceae bacterium]